MIDLHDRSWQFASFHFGTCVAHRQEAQAVHVALEKIGRLELPAVDPDVPIGVTLGLGSTHRSDSLDVLEHLMALEEEFGEGLVPEESEVSLATWEKAVMSAVLGTAARYSSWQPETIWVRSARGVINERVRWRAGCSCALGSGAVQQKDAADEVRAGNHSRGPRS